jgi:GNAT superfamily N-acetyltransferase
MGDVRWPPLDCELARRIECTSGEAAVEYAAAMACLLPEIGAGAEALAGGTVVFAGGSRASRAFALGLDGPVGEGDLDRLDDFYRRRRAPAVVDVCPFVDPSLPEALGRRGYRISTFDQVWIRPVSRDETFAEVPGVEARRTTADEAELWSRTVGQGFTGSEEITADVMALGRATCLMPRAGRYLAWIAGEPVGAGAVIRRSGLAMLMATSTRLHARGRGAHTALLRARLAEAAEEGCDLALVCTAPGSDSQRNIERIGFRLSYTRVELTLQAP